MFIKDVDSGKESALGRFDAPMVVDQWTPDGRFVIARTSASRLRHASEWRREGTSARRHPHIGGRGPRLAGRAMGSV